MQNNSGKLLKKINRGKDKREVRKRSEVGIDSSTSNSQLMEKVVALLDFVDIKFTFFR